MNAAPLEPQMFTLKTVEIHLANDRYNVILLAFRRLPRSYGDYSSAMLPSALTKNIFQNMLNQNPQQQMMIAQYYDEINEGPRVEGQDYYGSIAVGSGEEEGGTMGGFKNFGGSSMNE